MGVSEWNGVVSDEDERNGVDEMRRATKAVRLRNTAATSNHFGHQAESRALFLALA